MITPIQADNIMIHNGTMSGFGSGIGTAAIFTSCDFNGFACGSPMYGKRATLEITMVDKFNGTFGATYYKKINIYKYLNYNSNLKIIKLIIVNCKTHQIKCLCNKAHSKCNPCTAISIQLCCCASNQSATASITR